MTADQTPQPRTVAGRALLTWSEGATDYHDAYCEALTGHECSCGLPDAILAIEAEAALAPTPPTTAADHIFITRQFEFVCAVAGCEHPAALAPTPPPAPLPAALDDTAWGARLREAISGPHDPEVPTVRVDKGDIRQAEAALAPTPPPAPLDVAVLEKAIRHADLPLMYADESLPLDEDWPDYAKAIAREYLALLADDPADPA